MNIITKLGYRTMDGEMVTLAESNSRALARIVILQMLEEMGEKFEPNFRDRVTSEPIKSDKKKLVKMIEMLGLGAKTE